MCGRFTDDEEDPYSGRGIRYKYVDCAFKPRYNICPSQNARVISCDAGVEPAMKSMCNGSA
jgi:hypothetical protein